MIVDEVHDRDINTDFLLILLCEIVRSGGSDGVEVVLMSASMDSRMFAEYFRSARWALKGITSLGSKIKLFAVALVYAIAYSQTNPYILTRTHAHTHTHTRTHTYTYTHTYTHTHTHTRTHTHTHAHTRTHTHTHRIPHVLCVTVQGRCFPVTDHHLTEVRKLIGWRGPIDGETLGTHVIFVAEAVSYLAHSQPMASDDYIIMTSGD